MWISSPPRAQPGVTILHIPESAFPSICIQLGVKSIMFSLHTFPELRVLFRCNLCMYLVSSGFSL